jgi:hypothetical protein
MSKYRFLGALLMLATWSGAYVPNSSQASSQASSQGATTQGRWQVGAVAQAGVRWTPNPDRGSASSTLSGGRRGTSASACALDAEIPDPAITLLVPEGSAGLTTAAQPTLSWFLESKNTVDMEFVLSHPDQATPVYTKHVTADAGLVEVALPESAALEVGTRYRWTVFVSCNNGENEVHARSFVERVADSELAGSAGALSDLELASAYAERGIWYDALNTLINAYRDDSELNTLLEIRELLNQANTDVPLDLSLARGA